ncbi:MAG: OmpA family protein [Ignavibacteria bacterium]|nr:OmpA family protein [Ignavibacteria bacterium]
MLKHFKLMYTLCSLSIMCVVGTTLSGANTRELLGSTFLDCADSTRQRIKDVLYHGVEIVDTVRVLRNVPTRQVIRGRESKTEKVEENTFDVITTLTTKRTDTLLIPDTQSQFPTPVFGVEVEAIDQWLGGLTCMPFLPFVFFDENSAVIPNRYLDEGEQTKTTVWNRPDYFVRLQNEVLMRLGKALQLLPECTVTLVGCNSNFGLERENEELSYRRANSIQHYLHENFKIDKSRISVEAQNLPTYAWDSKTESGAAFNQRVELRASCTDVLSVMVEFQTHELSDVDNLKEVLLFKPRISAGAELTFWELKVTQAETVLKSFSGNTSIPQQLEWVLDSATVGRISSDVDLTYQLTARNNRGESASYSNSILGFNQSASVYLIPFYDAYSTQVPSGLDSMLSEIRSTAKPASTIRITGYSTPLANEPLSKKIALERANNVRLALDFNNQDGQHKTHRVVIDEKAVPHSFNTPDERIIFNAVRVVVCTERK